MMISKQIESSGLIHSCSHLPMRSIDSVKCALSKALLELLKRGLHLIMNTSDSWSFGSKS